MKSKNTTESYEQRRAAAGELGSRYHKIGISAVAAAVRYQSESRNPAYAPSVPKSDSRTITRVGRR